MTRFSIAHTGGCASLARWATITAHARPRHGVCASSRQRGGQDPMPATARAAASSGRSPERLEEAPMRLFKREKPRRAALPAVQPARVQRRVDACPMCGWDVREAYQGPAPAQPAGHSDHRPDRTGRQDPPLIPASMQHRAMSSQPHGGASRRRARRGRPGMGLRIRVWAGSLGLDLPARRGRSPTNSPELSLRAQQLQQRPLTASLSGALTAAVDAARQPGEPDERERDSARRRRGSATPRAPCERWPASS